MAKVFAHAFLDDSVIPVKDCHLPVTSSAVLYGLSVYTVLPVTVTPEGLVAFNLAGHFQRLINSSQIIGIDTFATNWDYEKFVRTLKETIAANDIKENVFVRISVHVNEPVPGTRSRGLRTTVSMFVYEAQPILPKTGARLKTSVWRRIPDNAIPSRAKVNGAYVNSVLAKQDAVDSGYDDCLFLDINGHVCELSAANIFIVRNGCLITPSNSSDILEGINRSLIFTLAAKNNLTVIERNVDLTELYIADEAFACGTSAFVAPILEIDKRVIGDGAIGPITAKLQTEHQQALRGAHTSLRDLVTLLS